MVKTKKKLNPKIKDKNTLFKIIKDYSSDSKLTLPCILNNFMIISKKGSIQVLYLLRYLPKQYNSLKNTLCLAGKDNRISSRTLDIRLKELLDSNLITKNSDRNINDNKEYYSLTQKGIIILSLIEVMTKLNDTDGQLLNILNPENINSLKNLNNFINRRITRYVQLQWNKVEQELINSINVDNIIYTSAHQKENIITRVNKEGLRIHTDKGNAIVKWETIREVWENLATDGILRRDDHNKASYRSSFICALFLRLKYVITLNEKPLIIGINESQFMQK